MTRFKKFVYKHKSVLHELSQQDNVNIPLIAALSVTITAVVGLPLVLVVTYLIILTKGWILLTLLVCPLVVIVKIVKLWRVNND